MSKLVRLTDEVGSLLEERAKKDNASLAGEIKLLLDGKDDNNINQRLGKMGVWMKKEFDAVKSLIEDTAIDRLDATPVRKHNHDSTPSVVEWEKLWPLFYEKLDEKNPAWLPGAYAGAHESSDMAEATYYIDYDKGVLWSDFFGVKTEWLKLTSEVLDYLAHLEAKKGEE